MVSRPAWQKYIPVEKVNYSFNLEEFPTLPGDDLLETPNTSSRKNRPDATATTTASTTTPMTHGGAATAVSAITEDMVSTTVKQQIAAFSKDKEEKQTALDARMDLLEQQISDLSKHIDSVSTRLADTVINKLTSPTGILTKHAKKMDEQAKSTAKLMDMLTRLAASVKKMTDATEKFTEDDPPSRKKSRRSGSPTDGESLDYYPSDTDTALDDASIQQE